MSERIDDPTFKANDYAINKVYGQDEFSFGGHIYEKSGGSTFLKHDEIPGGTVEVHPNAAAEIDAKRLQQEVDKQIVQVEPDTRQKYRMATEEEIKESLDSPALPALNAIQGAIFGAPAGPRGMILGATQALVAGTPGYWEKGMENLMRTRPTVPIFENMTPEEIGSHYGHM